MEDLIDLVGDLAEDSIEAAEDVGEVAEDFLEGLLGDLF